MTISPACPCCCSAYMEEHDTYWVCPVVGLWWIRDKKKDRRKTSVLNTFPITEYAFSHETFSNFIFIILIVYGEV